MILCRWEDLPECMKLPEVKPYYDILSNDYIRDQSIYIKPYGMMWLYNHRPENLEDY